MTAVVTAEQVYRSLVRRQIFLCLERHTNEAKGSIQSRIDPFASFACQTADNCDKSYSLHHCRDTFRSGNNTRTTKTTIGARYWSFVRVARYLVFLKQLYGYSFYQCYISTLNCNKCFGYRNLLKWLLGSLRGNMVKTNQRVGKSGKINITFIS